MKIRRFLFYLSFICLFFSCNEDNVAKNSLVEFQVEPHGENCSVGGIKLISGLDLNANNVLDENEIQNTEYVCNGNNGNSSLLNVIPEPIGENCSSGGFRIESGVDLDMNGILDENEIQNIEYVCNGNDGLYNKQSTILFNNDFHAWDTSWVLIRQDCYIYNFNFSNYEGVDSVAFGAYMYVGDNSATGYIELFDVTNNKAINNSQLSTNSTSGEWITTTFNFLEDIPKTPIILAARIKTSIGDVPANFYYPQLTLYRK